MGGVVMVDPFVASGTVPAQHHIPAHARSLDELLVAFRERYVTPVEGVEDPDPLLVELDAAIEAELCAKEARPPT